MKSEHSTKPRLTGAATAPLLFWLLVVCGLAGLTLLRMDSVLGSDVPADVIPLWIGSIGGVAIGQLLASLRLRMWILGVVSLGASWFLAPFLFFIFSGAARGDVSTCAIAFAPAAVCGYFSLSERGGLIAFWYPTILWMLVILDGPAPGVFDARGSLPFVIGLAALFVAFLFAKQTRRLAIWRTHGSVRIATSISRTVLRASPVRTVSQMAWTGIVGGAALMLSAWIAPHLWQKEQAKNASLATSGSASGGSVSKSQCCAENASQGRIREYFSLGSGYLERHVSDSSCVPCNPYNDGASTYGSASLSQGGEKSFHSWYSTQPNSGIPNSYYGAPGGTYAAVATPPPPVPDAAGHSTTGTTVDSAVASSSSPSEIHAANPGGTVAVTPTAAAAVAPSPPKSVTSPSTPANVAAVATPSTPSHPAAVSAKPGAPLETGAPWKSLFAFCAGGILFHLLTRALRRKLTLRHLARPFWSETLDQRISNHWQRMLIGLRDAGIHPARDEQPQAFARRVGIEGMGTCATILERVRHGVRVESTDLDEMGAAANAVYRAARSRAGAGGRAAAWLRWPLV